MRSLFTAMLFVALITLMVVAAQADDFLISVACFAMLTRMAWHLPSGGAA